MLELFGIFVNVLAPVFLLVVVGYIIGPRLQLEARTLSRFAYYILVPCFVFDVLSRSHIAAGLALRMMSFAVVVHLICAAAGWLCARLLHRSAPMTAAYTLIAIFGNVGNFGPPIVQFRYPDEPLVLEIATIYFLAILSVSFIVGVLVANWQRAGRTRAIIAVLKTPALWAVAPAVLVNALDWHVPVAITRPIALLAAAMIPVMVVGLGVQLAQAGVPRLNADMLLASAIRLMGAPLLALLLAAPFGLVGLERSIGVVQSAMPTAVLASIIAIENDLLPEFVTAVVLFSTLASVVTLTLVLAWARVLR